MANLETVIIPDTVTQYGGTWSQGMFANNPKLTTVGKASSYVDGVVDLSWMGNTYADGKYYAFCPGSTSIKAIKLEGLTGGLYLRAGTFEGCTALESITIPASGWTQIEAGAFNNCTSLKTVTILEPFDYDSAWPAGDPFSGCPIETIIITNKDNLLVAQPNLKAFCDAKVAAGASVYDYEEYYMEYPITGSYANGHFDWSISEDGVMTITPTQAAVDNAETYGGKVVILLSMGAGDDVDNLMKHYDKYISTVRIVNTDDVALTEIYGGISDMKTLQTIVIPDTVNSWFGRWGGNGFANNTALTTLVKESAYVADTTGVVDFSWFNIPWGDGKYDNIFAGCSAITNIELGTSPVYWLRGTFANCTSLKSVNFSSATASSYIEIIGSTFAGCTALESFYMVKADPIVAASAFEGCSNLTIYCMDGSTMETVANELVAAGTIEGVKTLASGVTFDGYKVRTAGYNGLRGIMYFNNTNDSAFKLLEYGGLVVSADNRAKEAVSVSYDLATNAATASKGVMLVPVFETVDGVLEQTGKTLTNADDTAELPEGATCFAVSLVKFDTAAADNHLADNVYIAGYEVWQFGDEVVVFLSDYGTGSATVNEEPVVSNGETSLYKMCKYAISQNAALASNAIISPVISKVEVA